MLIEDFFDWLPAISPEKALTLFVIIDALILLATVVYVLRHRQRRGSPQRTTHHKYRPPNIPRQNRYYDVEESTQNGSKDMGMVMKALSHLPNPNEMPAFPEPSLDGTPDHLKILVAKSRDPHLFTRSDVVITPPLPMDGRPREVQGHKTPDKKKNRDGFVV